MAAESRGSDVGEHRQPGNWIDRKQPVMRRMELFSWESMVREARSGPHWTAVFRHRIAQAVVRRVWAPAPHVVPANFESRLFLVFSFPAVLER